MFWLFSEITSAQVDDVIVDEVLVIQDESVGSFLSIDDEMARDDVPMIFDEVALRSEADILEDQRITLIRQEILISQYAKALDTARNRCE